MPRGVRLTEEEKQARLLEKQIKKEEMRIYRLAKKNETKLKREEAKLLRSISKAFAPKRPRGRRVGVKEPFIGPLTKLQTTRRENARLRALGELPPLVVKSREPFIGPLTKRQTTLRENKALRALGLSPPKAPKASFIGPLTKRQTTLRENKALREQGIIPGVIVEKPRKSYQRFIGPLTQLESAKRVFRRKKTFVEPFRALQELSNEVPLPPMSAEELGVVRAPRRVRVMRQYQVPASYR